MVTLSKRQGYEPISDENKNSKSGIGLWGDVLKGVLLFLIGLGVFIVGMLCMRYRNEKMLKSSPNNIEVSPKAEHSMPYRPCEIYESKKGFSSVEIIQTSLGEPSAQWAEVPCFTVQKERISSGTNGDNYRTPSAQIRVDSSGSPFEDRSPILGFGGAFTEAAALNYNSLNDAGKKASMELLFGESGLGYTLGRVHMNSCDFCIASYAFDTEDQDFSLETFDMSVQHDVASGMIEMMHEANKYAMEGWPKEHGQDSDMAVKILASPWSPPAWMKAPTPDDPPGVSHAQEMTGSHQPSCLRDGTGPDSKYAQAWALYFTKFISAYKSQGVDLWAVTVQNEPEFPAPWEACSYTPDVESEFVAYHLGPMLNETHPDVKLFIFDHNKDHAPKWAETIISPKKSTDSEASKYVDGVAVHWYAGGMDRLLDGGVGAANMHRLLGDLEKAEKQEKKKNLVLGSEACHCPSTGYAGGDLNVAWDRAQRYAHTVLSDLAAGSNGWIEWNMILDAIGGPNHLGNMCDAPILAVPYRATDAEEHNIPQRMPWEVKKNPFGPIIGDGRTKEELHALGVPAKYLDVGLVVQPMYYFMGHISRHVRPGSRAVKALVDSSNTRDDKGNDDISFPARTFRPLKQEIPGGGINDLARNGVEVTLWPCEGSTRQEWKFDSNQLKVFGHDWLGNPTTSCLSKHVDPSFQGLTLNDCNATLGDPGYFEMESVKGDADFVKFTSAGQQSCLLVKPLENKGGAYGERGGAQVEIGDCSHDSAKWKFSSATGEVSSEYFESGEVCLTTGWPFLQVGAFRAPETSEKSHTVVILNEAGESANFELKDGDKVVVTASIPPHSIQTILYDVN